MPNDTKKTDSKKSHKQHSQGNRDRNRRNPKHRDRKRKKPTNRVSEHFSKRDFACHCGDCNKAFRISLGLVGALEYLRSESKKRVTIHKAYECPESKEKSGNFRRNYFATGIAVTVTVDELPLVETFKICESIPEVKGLAIDFKNQVVYLDTRKEDERSTWIVDPDGKETPITDALREKHGLN